jgi:hypothetical protein
MQKSAAMLLTMSFLVNTAHAAVALAPGKPAGVDQAQVWDLKTLAVISGGAVLIVGFALLISGGTSLTTPISGGAGNSTVVAPTTTSTK